MQKIVTMEMAENILQEKIQTAEYRLQQLKCRSGVVFWIVNWIRTGTIHPYETQIKILEKDLFEYKKEEHLQTDIRLEYPPHFYS